MKQMAALTTAVVLAAGWLCCGDMFVNRDSGDVLYGYATQQRQEGKTLVQTTEGERYLDLNDYAVWRNGAGRKEQVVVIGVEGSIDLVIVAEAIEKAIVEASNEGPLCILVEIDTPGGRVDLARRISAAITQTDNCEVAAFIRGRRYGGAFSAGTAIALACDKVYISADAAMGAAGLVTADDSGVKELGEAVGEQVSEKLLSAWRGYIGALAEAHGRSRLMATAMVDEQVEVVEVERRGERMFVEPAETGDDGRVVRWWSRAGSLLSLTASQAADCGMADKVVGSRREVLADLRAGSAEVVEDNAPAEARRTFEKVLARFKKVSAELDYHRKQFQEADEPAHRKAHLRDIISDYEDLVRLARSYPDLGVDAEVLGRQLNSYRAAYNGARMRR